MKVLTNEELTSRLEALEKAFLASTKRAIDNTYTAESANSKADALTPTKYTKLGYIGDTEVRFFDVVDGDLSIYIVDTEGKTPFYSVTKGDCICVSFPEPLNYVTTITISIS